MIHKNVLEVVGNTPIIKLNRVAEGCLAELYAKLEFMNPGGSIKDRIGEWMILDAVKKGRLKPGGTIVEGTSGNTGVGLAIASAIHGYKCVFVLPDKMSQEKIRNLRAFGAKVVVTPTAVEPDDPRSYYSVSRRLATETPNSIYIDQYNNLSNRECHEATTGPEILKQFPDVDYIVAGIGTGGTICGLGRYFKKAKPGVKLIAVDPVGSIVFEAYKTGVIKTRPKTYKIEGIGEDFLPGNYDFSVIHDMIQVEDKESFLTTRDLLSKEGLFCGISSGSAVVGALKWVQAQGNKLKGKKVLVILPDSGNRYLSKVFDDDWMREAGFLDDRGLGTVSDLLHVLQIKPGQVVFAQQNDKISQIIDLMRLKGISQVPLQDAKGWIKGVITESGVLKAIYEGHAKPNATVAEVMEKIVDSRFEPVQTTDTVEKLSQHITQGKIPLVVENEKLVAILTKIDLLTYMGART